MRGGEGTHPNDKPPVTPWFEIILGILALTVFVLALVL